MRPERQPRREQNSNDLPDIGAVLALLEATGPGKKLQEAGMAQQLQDRQSTSRYAQEKGYPSLPAMQLAQTDEDRDARLAAFEQSKQEQLAMQKSNAADSLLSQGAGYLPPEVMQTVLAERLKMLGIDLPPQPQRIADKIKKSPNYIP